MKPVRIVNLGTVSYLESQSIYHAVAVCLTEQSPDTVILCRPREPYFCLGYHQSSLQVIDSNARVQLGYPIMRRKLGGGLTYLDHQQQFYQCIFHRNRSPSTPTANYRIRLDGPIRALRKIGMDVGLRYTNEIEVRGKRIAGIGGGFIGEASVVVGNILNHFDFSAMAQIINAPCNRFREIALKKMKDRITMLRSETRTDHWSQLSDLLIEEFGSSFGGAYYLEGLTRKERDEATRQAELMTAKDYLERRDEIAWDIKNTVLTRLKISGSTWMCLVKINGSSLHTHAIVVIKNGVIEYREFVEDYAINSNTKLVGLKVMELAETEIGRTLN